MATNNIATLAENLEKLELENSAAGVAVQAEAYLKLLAIYLYQNDLCNAKFLWKRTPVAIKNSNKELENLWKVGQKMWQRDFAGIYVALSEQWSPAIAEIMEGLKVKIREKAAKRVATAYSSISLDALAKDTGLSLQEAEEQAVAAGWQVDKETGFVEPAKPKHPPAQAVSCEEQLRKLTDFVSFLEN